MISRISGKISAIFNDYVSVDIKYTDSIIGYDVFLKYSEIKGLNVDDYIDLHIRQLFKEEGQYLYGFTNILDKFGFDEFIKLSGLGSKIAIAILSNYTTDEISNAIYQKDDKIFSTISGVGPKIANRIVNEMQNAIARISKISIMNTSSAMYNLSLKFDSISHSSLSAKQANSAINEAVEALTNLGFAKHVAHSRIAEIAKRIGKNATTEELVREFLSSKA